MATAAYAVWFLKCVGVGAASVASACYVRRACVRLSPGAARLRVILPFIAQFVLSPLVFSKEHELLSRACCAGILLWLANFKLFLFALNRGPLADSSLSLDQWVALLLWPLLHKQDADGCVQLWSPQTTTSPHSTQGPGDETAANTTTTGGKVLDVMSLRRHAAIRRLTFRVPENLIIALLGIWTLTHSGVPLFAKTYSAAFSVSCFCDLFANAAAALVIWMHGLDTALSWNRPWLQNCLSDFWSRRWNLAAAYSLRALIFEPIMDGELVRHSQEQRTRNVQLSTDATNGNAHKPSTNVRNANGHAVDLAPADEQEANDKDDDVLLHSKGVGSTCKAAGKVVTSNGKEASQRRHRDTGKKRASAVQRLIALAVVFAVSGFMHEVLLLLCTGWAAYWPSAGWQMAYFMLQVPASIAEQVLAKSFKRANWMPPNFVAIVFTSLSLQIPGLYLFWTPIFNAATSAMQNGG